MNGRTPPAPLYEDPVHGAPTDPVLVRGPVRPDGCEEWWMFYTQRRAHAAGPGVSWVHGTDIGVATSTDGGASWLYRGTVGGLDPSWGRNTLWAPEVIHAEGRYHMFVSYITGVPDRWEGHPRTILHLVSDDLVAWEHRGAVPLGTRRAIDACVSPLPEGGYRLWFKNESAGSQTWCADSRDLRTWGESRPVLTERHHEGPNVFQLGGHHWMIVDEWCGQRVHRSEDLASWQERGLILAEPGARPGDGSVGHHADVVVGRDADGAEVVWIVYFTHPGLSGDVGGGAEGRTPATREAVIQVAEIREVDGDLVCDRDRSFDFDLRRAIRAPGAWG